MTHLGGVIKVQDNLWLFYHDLIEASILTVGSDCNGTQQAELITTIPLYCDPINRKRRYHPLCFQNQPTVHPAETQEERAENPPVYSYHWLWSLVRCGWISFNHNVFVTFTFCNFFLSEAPPEKTADGKVFASLLPKQQLRYPATDHLHKNSFTIFFFKQVIRKLSNSKTMHWKREIIPLLLLQLQSKECEALQPFSFLFFFLAVFILRRLAL